MKRQPLLLDADERVRLPLWPGFYQQASQTHLMSNQDDRLRALVQHTCSI